MIYRLIFSKEAQDDLRYLRKSEPKPYVKALQLLEEIQEHPHFGRGKPKMMKGDLSGCWSRRISHRHRLVYRIEEQTVTVLVLSAGKHYDDK